MRAFTQKQNCSQKPASSSLVRPHKRASTLIHDPHAMPHLQRTRDDQIGQQSNTEEFNVGSASTTSSRFAHDFSRIPVHSKTSAQIQPKLTVNTPGDKYEQEADRVAEQVMRMPEPKMQQLVPATERISGDEHLQTTRMQASGVSEILAPSIIQEAVHSPGQPLEPSSRSFIESRLGYDFGQVRVHADAKGAESAQAIGAAASTGGHDIVFGVGRFAPATYEGRKLIAHELAHVAQQSGAAGIHVDKRIQRQPEGSEATDTGPGPVATGTGDVSVYVGKTMTSEAALRQIYREGAREISEEALRMVAQGTPVEDAARWANQARNDLKSIIRLKGSPIIRGLAEARNIRKYGNKIGPTYEELIRQGKTPEDIIGSAGKSSTKVNRVATKLKVGGRFFIGVDLAIVTWEVISAPEGERLRTAVSGGAGVVGAKGGAAFGSFFGPIGTAVGGVIGGIGGALIGGWIGRKTAQKAYDLVEDLVNPPSGSVWDLQVIVIDGIEEEYIRTQALRRP